ncbi:hypothetical protein ACFFX1_42645 [Dactylosporangium sucinum]|uniref:HEAT repeat domain-containing protein n=1 Tax=Dactylosporangium sucinum TaxID=1424081 RepID=A0A917U6T3_9ACTN|nr:hypothetical protein [Dactylosporangium sucinum]GGM63021.1 hypothetical protein GCM10007977_075770 [Dactylosporangium sucinum]
MVFNGELSDLPGHLDGLRDEGAFDQALRSLRHALFVQGTVAPAAESVAPALVAAAVELPGERRDRVIELLWEMLTGGGYLAAAAQDSPIRPAVAAQREHWRALAEAGSPWAARLLSAAGGDTLASAQRATGLAQAELTLGLSIWPPTEAAVGWLYGQLEATDRRQRFCAALALARLGDPAGAAILTDVPEECRESFWIGYDPTGEARAALARLGAVPTPEEFAKIPAVSAIGLAAALLDAQGPTPEVLRAFTAHERIWGYLNFTELLERHGRPAHRTPPPAPR